MTEVFIEISKGTNIKYEYEDGKLTVDRFLNVPVSYPFNYGYIPNTLGGDGDALLPTKRRRWLRPPRRWMIPYSAYVRKNYPRLWMTCSSFPRTSRHLAVALPTPNPHQTLLFFPSSARIVSPLSCSSRCKRRVA